jgi:tetraacyldisaccharide 4'-kinase
VLLDATHPFGNAHLFPRGPLREPVASLARCHAVVFTRSNTPEPSGIRASIPFLETKPTYYSNHESRLIGIVPVKANCPEMMDARISNGHMNYLKGKRVWAFAGIARNEDFFNSLQSNGCEIEGVSSFPDHHKYNRGEFQEIIKTATHRGVDCMVTTEKDYCRITFDIDRPLDLVVMGVDLIFQDNAFDQFIQTCLSLYRSSNQSRKE